MGGFQDDDEILIQIPFRENLENPFSESSLDLKNEKN